jgi:hypothetical protein
LIKLFLERFIVALDTAIRSLPRDGPHYPTILYSSPTTNDNDNNIYPNTTTTPEWVSSTKWIHIIQWVCQFYTAYYYIRGTYPTILHQWFRIRPVSTLTINNTTDVTNNASTTTTGNQMIPIVGTLIMLQLSWKLLVKGISERALNVWIQRKPRPSSFRQWWNHLRKKCFNPPKEFLHMKGIAPIIYNASTTSSEFETTKTKIDDGKDASSNVLVCGICRNSGSTTTSAVTATKQPFSTSNNNGHDSIQFPSCSIRCGHVFCWYCIQQWLTYYDTKCPICRTICTTNDIQLLYNY